MFALTAHHGNAQFIPVKFHTCFGSISFGEGSSCDPLIGHLCVSVVPGSFSQSQGLQDLDGSGEQADSPTNPLGSRH